MKKINTVRITKQILCYQAGEQRSIGCQIKRWKENMGP